MKALSIRQPWAWLIVNGYKDIENRSWSTNYRGEFFVHASAGMTRDEYDEALEVAWSIDGLIPFPRREELQRGGIVGTAILTDCVRGSESLWYFGDRGFVVNGAKPLPFLPLKGQLQFFETGLVPADVERLTVTAKELGMLRHSLGLDRNSGKGKEYRNYYASAPGCIGHDGCESLVSKGYMEKPDTVGDRYTYFKVTEAGKIMAAKGIAV